MLQMLIVGTPHTWSAIQLHILTVWAGVSCQNTVRSGCSEIEVRLQHFMLETERTRREFAIFSVLFWLAPTVSWSPGSRLSKTSQNRYASVR